MTSTRLIIRIAAMIILVANMVIVGVLAQNNQRPATTEIDHVDGWALDTSFGFAVRIAYTSASILSPGYTDRVMFLLIEERYYSPDALRIVFSRLAERYQESDSLTIDVYCDAEMLRRAIERYKRYPDDLTFPDTPEGAAFEKLVRGDLYIPKNGWAHASYFKRPKDGERFFYKPYPEKVERVEVVIKPAPMPEYVGDLQLDLFLACRLGDLPKAKALIENGARVDHKNDVGETSLAYAVGHNRPQIVKLLLAHGAYVDAKNKYGQTALNEALSHGFREIIGELLEHKADVNARYGPGISPLHLASYRGDADSVDALLAKGADPNATDRDGNTPIFDAIPTRKSRIVKALLNSGAWSNVHNNRGQTPHNVAAGIGDQAIMELLRIADERSRRK